MSIPPFDLGQARYAVTPAVSSRGVKTAGHDLPDIGLFAKVRPCGGTVDVLFEHLGVFCPTAILRRRI